MIEYNETMKLSDYGIGHSSSIGIYLPLPSYSSAQKEQTIEKRQVELLPLPGLITVTTTEPDMITFDDDPTCKRAKMPCGHVIGA